MTRRMTCSFVLACVLALAGMMLPAFAAPSDTQNVGGGNLEIGSLSDRFESLDKLGNSLTDEENVVIETRVGVLVSTNRALNDSEVSFTARPWEASSTRAKATSGPTSAVLQTPSSASTCPMTLPSSSKTWATTIRRALRSRSRAPTTSPVRSTRASLTCTHLPPRSQTTVAPVTHMVVPGRLEAALALCAVAALFLMLYLLARRYFQRKAQHDVL